MSARGHADDAPHQGHDGKLPYDLIVVRVAAAQAHVRFPDDKLNLKSQIEPACSGDPTSYVWPRAYVIPPVAGLNSLCLALRDRWRIRQLHDAGEPDPPSDRS